MSLPRSYTREGALRFPLWPAAHGIAWRYVFDWAVAGEMLQCAPGDRILEFGSGPAYASEWLNRLGYSTVAIDLNPEILDLARARFSVDGRLAPERAAFVAADGQRLPFADASFDGVLCLNALHHMPDYALVLREMHRVLRPGGRAVFSEPGALHADAAESRVQMEQYGALEKSVHLDEIDRLARATGFARMLLKPFVYPDMVELPYAELGAYRRGRSRAAYLQPDDIARFLIDLRAVFALEAPGRRPLTSARPGLLRAAIRLSGLPASSEPGERFTAQATVRNDGDTRWLSGPRPFGGDVALGVKLCAADGRVVSDTLARAPIPHPVDPGRSIELSLDVAVPFLAPGAYQLRADMLAEQVAWFEERGSPIAAHALTITPRSRPITSDVPSILRAAIGVEAPPASMTAAGILRLEARVQNVGDTIWLAPRRPQGGHVSFGVKLCTAAGVVLDDALGRTLLTGDVAPGETAAVVAEIALPALPAGAYLLRFDMVHELRAWFEDLGSVVVVHRFVVAEADTAPPRRG